MDRTIKIIRGTTNSFEIALKNEEGNFYMMQPGDVLRFGVKTRASLNTYELLKEMTAADINDAGDAYVLQLDPADTENMDFRRYCYDIGLQTGGAYFNVIPCSDFIVHHNITKREV